MSEFLLEILAEEIPAGFLHGARNDLLRAVAGALADQRINGTFFVQSTSRRLILRSDDLPEGQEDVETDAAGPPASAAWDAEGRPTRAAEGFARGQGVDVASLVAVDTPKGRYASARKRIEGRPTSDVLAEVLPGVVERMAFPKTMRWGDGKPSWVRPVHSVVALFDGLVVPFTVFGVETGRVTVGHRTLAPERVIATGADDYLAKLRKSCVEPDYAERRRRLFERARELAEEVGGVPAEDPALVDTWANLVEWPGLVRGAFREEFLKLPDEVLVTSMREHQKVLPVRSPDGRLMPYFLAVADHTGDPKGLIVRGNEWVLNARFADARFFWQEDLKQTLEDRLPKLSSLQFQEKLGDTLKRTGRIQELSEKLAERLGLSHVAPAAVRAARLMKTDLVSAMVREFTDLQGVVGGLYARQQGEPEPVWQAIYDQYRPASAEDDVPRGEVGGIVALADRLDTLAGLFGLGLVPTGSKDPYALRRAALGVVKILLDKGWRVDLPRAAADALALHAGLPRGREEVLADLEAFFAERLRHLLERRGFRHDEVEAVLTTDCRDVSDAADRVSAVAAIRKKEDFLPLSIAFKRIQNILAQAGEGAPEPDPALLSEDAERQLASDYFQARGMIDLLVGSRQYAMALSVMASLGPSLDRFFTEVLVLAEDEAVRRNRIALLRAMRDQFARVARFNEIQG